MLNALLKAFDHYVWHCDLRALPWPKRFLIYWLRLLQVLVQDFTSGEITLRATGLVYTTLLAIVPMLAFIFSILKALGVQESLEPFLYDFLKPLGSKGEEITAKIINFVDNVKVGVLGIIGLLVLMYAVVSLVQKLETGLNSIWRVREVRTLSERFSHYLSVLLIGPLLLVMALAITATLSSSTMAQHIRDFAPLGPLLIVGIKLLPYLLVICAFTFIYALVPHTHVQFRAALAGGVFAGVLWEFASWAFAALTVSSTHLTVIYSGFAILIMFMVWMYLCWLILFSGAQVAFYVQNPELVQPSRLQAVGARTLEHLALQIMYVIGRRFHDNQPPWSREEIAQNLRAPTEAIVDVLGHLHEAGLVILISGRIRRYVPARDLGTITLLDVVNAIRQSPVVLSGTALHLNTADAVDACMKKLDLAIESALGVTTLRELVEQNHSTTVAELRQHA